jgi:hypothetical protein
MSQNLAFITQHYQPIIGLIFGLVMLIVTCLINVGNTKMRTARWIRHALYNDDAQSEYLTQKFISGISKFFLLFGLMLVILALYFLQNIK